VRKVKVEDVMTREVIAAREETPYKDLARLMSDHGVSGIPILDDDRRLIGIVTEADLLLAEESGPEHPHLLLRWLENPKRLAALRHEAEGVRAADVMTTHVVTVRPEDDVRKAAKVLLDAGVKRLPVVDGNRRVVGIVSRRDLLRPYLRSDEDIREEVTEEVIQRVMAIDPRSVTVRVRDGVVGLEGQVEKKSVKEILVELVHRVDGVLGVDDHLSFEHHDREMRRTGPYVPFAGAAGRERTRPGPFLTSPRRPERLTERSLRRGKPTG